MKATPFRIVGAACLLIGSVMWGLGTYVLVQASTQQERFESAKVRAEKLCQKQLEGMQGATVRPVGDELRVEFGDIADPRIAIGDATAALGYCPMRKLTYFCLGSDCTGAKPDSVSMLFRLSH